MSTSSILYPNLYTFLVGHPGVGKTRVIRAMKSYLQEIPEFHFAPTSMTAPSLVDALVEAKRNIIRMGQGEGNLEYNAMTITAEELTAFMHKYDDEMIGVLSAFYDPDPYLHHRRGKDIRIKIKHPQLNIISGTTPSNLLKFLPEFAWDQGFTSRVCMIYSDERKIGDDFAAQEVRVHADMVHDLQVMNAVNGKFEVSEEYHQAVNNWRQLGEPPVPNHPKLLHYNTRRRVHLYKLSMVAGIDRGGPMVLGKDDFNKALGWLVEAELYMPEVFRAGAVGADAKAMDEIHHYILSTDRGRGVPEHRVVNFARERVPAYAVDRVLLIMERAQLIRAETYDPKLKTRLFKALPRQDSLGWELLEGPYLPPPAPPEKPKPKRRL
jgi:hypothetical protein